MGKTWRRDKTVSKQRNKIGKTSKGKNKSSFHYSEFDYDESVDSPKYNTEEIKNERKQEKASPPELPDEDKSSEQELP